MHDTLLHWKPLFIVATSDFEDVAFELGTDAVTWDFLAHAAVHEDAEFALIFDLDKLLCAIGGEGDVELHLDGWGADVKMGGGSGDCWCFASLEISRMESVRAKRTGTSRSGT